ncbi:MAG: S8 family serine peptidase [bacterium]|jgi:hypothetical protein|nr:S8 family serine peptidase [bacterium]
MNPKKLFQIVSLLSFFLALVVSVPAKPNPVDKLDSRLKLMIGQSDVAVQSIQDDRQLIRAGQGQVLVSVRLKNLSPEALDQLRQAGLTITARYQGLVSGTIDPSRLLTLASVQMVTTVETETRPIVRSVMGQHVEGLRLPDVQSRYPHLDGTGIKIGIISDSFGVISEATPSYMDSNHDGILEIIGTDSQLKGELPAIVEIVKEATAFLDANGNPIPMKELFLDEGRGMAEVLYDMVPGAQLAFYAPHSKADFAAGIIALATAGCQVIVDDLFWVTESLFQYDEIGLAIQEVQEKYDVAYFTATGNDGSQAFEQRYDDIDPIRDDGGWTKFPYGNDFHRWSGFGNRPYLSVVVPPLWDVWVLLWWENPYSGMLGPGATTDYDMLALSAPTYELKNIVDLSDSTQGTPESPMGDPQERVVLYNPSETEFKPFYLVINKHHGPAVNFRLAFVSNGGNALMIERSQLLEAPMTFGHTLSAHGLAVAAVNFLELFTEGKQFANPNRIDQVYYSSRGGVNQILYSNTGQPLEKPELVFKPDIASADGLNTSFFGRDLAFDEDTLPNFTGTSCAAPVAAGIAALMRQANPALTAPQILDLMRYCATDIAEPGVDYFTGYGFVYADHAIAVALNPPDPIPLPAVQDWKLHLMD